MTLANSVKKRLGNLLDYLNQNDTNEQQQDTALDHKKKYDEYPNTAINSNNSPVPNKKNRRYRSYPGGIATNPGTNNTKSYRKNAKKYTRIRNNGGIWQIIKNCFTAQEQELNDMKEQYQENMNNIPSNSLRTSRYKKDLKTRAQVQRIAKSEAFKKILMEKQYDQRMLKKLNEMNTSENKGSTPPAFLLDNKSMDQETNDKEKINQSNDDEIYDIMNKRILFLEKELELTKKKLKFSQEKVKLLEGLLDDAQLDNEMVKAKRKITNLPQALTAEPLPDLSPTKKKKPLFTSSPTRKNHEQQEGGDGNDIDSYKKIIPETLESNNNIDNRFDVRAFQRSTNNNRLSRFEESDLDENDEINIAHTHIEGNNRTSLSPIRIDYSKYSSPPPNKF
ncbi:uncharacterized protein SCODWIG_02237 [Saccharomycodes ludwigii]|uniref:Uncharacterized protein n=1 Tax=Saccharomycodes ludwigii TaxID=36035 RepID=A0A376B702_9ASCO|nr:hypothetical protein SCDLUD_000029 [Saccharomycodes ludwigii]KAH3902452.1 hypothetical protein SCDLUD_000029 [Saccharomycodes ludwigii]SSD60476.1 uncharacterized protein SCODWIG_02237 [Saccharomycodes ludwigii]